MPFVHPNDVIFQTANGTANMGTVADKTSIARFGLPNERYVLLFIRLHARDISGSASATTATVTVNVDSRNNLPYDCALYTIAGFGKSADQFLRIEPSEYTEWTFEVDDQLVLTWTNPDSGNLGWGVEVGIARASSVQA